MLYSVVRRNLFDGIPMGLTTFSTFGCHPSIRMRERHFCPFRNAGRDYFGRFPLYHCTSDILSQNPGWDGHLVTPLFFRTPLVFRPDMKREANLLSHFRDAP